MLGLAAARIRRFVVSRAERRRRSFMQVRGLDFRKTAVWEQEHMKLLVEIAPAEFDVLHYGALVELKRK